MQKEDTTLPDHELLERAGIVVEPHALAGPVLVFPLDDGDGGTVRVLWQGGSFESATYVDGRRDELVFEYLRLYDLMFRAKRPVRRVAMLGAGGCSYPRYLVAGHPRLRCDAVELDPAIARVARRWFFVDEAMRRSDGRLRLVVDDARHFLDGRAAAGRRYDAILNDCFRGDEPPADLATPEWMGLVHDCLDVGGAYLSNVVAPLEGAGSRALRDLARAARTAFAQVWAVPVDPQGDPGEPDNVMLVACDDALPLPEGARKL